MLKEDDNCITLKTNAKTPEDVEQWVLLYSKKFNYPEVLTAGVFTRAGPDREALKNLRFTATLIGRGWSESLLSGTDQYSKPPDSSITVKISGPDPGYAATSLMMVASAMTILREKEMCSGKGGVLTPGAAFMKTNFIDRIVSRGMTVTIED